MGYELQAFVAQRGSFDEYKKLSPYVTVAPVEQNFDLLLNDWCLAEALKINEFEPVEDFEDTLLNQKLFAITEAMSKKMPVAYIEASFFGGEGSQYAILWKAGKVALIPSSNGWQLETPVAERPINTVLRALGVKANSVDEFEALGLSKHRHMENWFEEFTEFRADDYYPE